MNNCAVKFSFDTKKTTHIIIIVAKFEAADNRDLSNRTATVFLNRVHRILRFTLKNIHGNCLCSSLCNVSQLYSRVFHPATPALIRLCTIDFAEFVLRGGDLFLSTLETHPTRHHLFDRPIDTGVILFCILSLILCVAGRCKETRGFLLRFFPLTLCRVSQPVSLCSSLCAFQIAPRGSIIKFPQRKLRERCERRPSGISLSSRDVALLPARSFLCLLFAVFATARWFYGKKFS